jgi:2-oxoglutarate dehydrogenase E2 component (dihydrolipoamide succinyltransferase)
MDVIMPQLGETVAEGTVTRWYKKVGDAVKADDLLFDVETDKVSTEIPAQANGVLAEILIAEGVTAKVGAKLAVIREPAPHAGVPGSSVPTAAPANAAGPAARGQASVTESGAPGRSLGTAGTEGRLSPVVRKLLAEHTLDPQQIAGTGRDGRITREDVLGHIAQREGSLPTVRTELPAKYVVAGPGTESIPLNKVRKRTAEHMARSWTTVPHVLQVVEADFYRVDQARRAAGEQWKRREGFSLTYLPFIARALAATLAKYPRLNASFGGDHLLVHHRINLGFAVDLNLEGLIVPVLKDAGGKALPELARAINDLATRARAGRLKPDDMTEGTYTITNNGAFGTLITAPIISPPQVAILSTDSIRKRPVVIEGPDGDSIAIRPVGMLAQTFDHRAVDGAYSGAFLNELKKLIETRDWGKELQG